MPPGVREGMRRTQGGGWVLGGLWSPPVCHPSSLNGPARTFLGTSIPSYENKGEPTCIICACGAEQLLLAVACPSHP